MRSPNIELFVYPAFFKWFNTIFWSIFSSSAMVRVLIWGSSWIFLKISSKFSSWGRPERGSSLTSKWPERKRAHQWTDGLLTLIKYLRLEILDFDLKTNLDVFLNLNKTLPAITLHKRLHKSENFGSVRFGPSANLYYIPHKT